MGTINASYHLVLVQTNNQWKELQCPEVLHINVCCESIRVYSLVYTDVVFFISFFFP